MMYCPQCRNQLTDDSKFCPHCGSAVKAASSSADAPTETAVANDSLLGCVIDERYELRGQLGEGAMGAVYRANRLHIGDEAAVKVLHRKFVGEEETMERFRREARAAAQLRHPNVVAIYDFGEGHDARVPAYIVMELVNGKSLRDVLRTEGVMGQERAIELMREICAGIAAAHHVGIVHRDIKPDNIIVIPPQSSGEAERIKVVDFGIAKLRDMSDALNLTQAGTLLGTPYYMSPEQCRGESLDARSDVYSLGALLYEMLTGAPPFKSPTLAGVISKHLAEPPPPFPPQRNISPALEAVVRRALAKEVGARQGDAAALGQELRNALLAFGNNAGLPSVQFASARTPNFTQTASPQMPAYAHTNQSFSHPTNPTLNAAPPPSAQNPVRSSRSWLWLVGLAALALAAVGIGFGAFMLMPNRNSGQANANALPPKSDRSSASRSTPAPAKNTNQKQLTPAERQNTQAEIANVLAAWNRAIEGRDIATHMSYYADTLNNYYNRSNVSANVVRRDKANAFSRYTDIEIKLSNIKTQLDSSGARATATFDKTWNFAGGERDSSGSVQGMVWLEKRGSDWLITGEKDLKVYYTSNGSEQQTSSDYTGAP